MFNEKPYYQENNAIIIQLRVIPNASKSVIMEPTSDANGLWFLKVKVSTPAEDGKANKAVLKLLSASWGVPSSHMTLVSGEKSRIKTIRIESSEERISNVLTWFAGFY